MTSKDELRTKICGILGIFPEELEHNLPVNIEFNTIDAILNLLEGEKQRWELNLHKEGWLKIDENALDELGKRLATHNKEPNKGEDVDEENN